MENRWIRIQNKIINLSEVVEIEPDADATIVFDLKDGDSIIINCGTPTERSRLWRLLTEYVADVTLD